MILKRVIERILNHKNSLKEFQKGSINNEEFENKLIEQIEYFQKDFEEQLSLEILEQEEKFFVILLQIKKEALKRNIDKETLKNMILSEINRSIVDRNFL